jgi:predicted DNA-binding protein (MmcQ/YjbR family)
MNIEQIRDHCLSLSHVTEDLPFNNHTLAFRVGGKIFGLVDLEREPAAINLKCDPEYALELREKHPRIIIPGYHMNKKHWKTVLIENSLHNQQIQELIKHSYDLVFQSLSRKVKEKL